MVAPYAGAWIEIFLICGSIRSHRSLPTRERGLKYQTEKSLDIMRQSLPTRERGLKFYPIKRDVAKFAGRSLRGSVD